MNRSKPLLIILAVALSIGAFFIGTTDRFAGDQNCGAALFPKDPGELVQESGDPIEDDFEAEVLRGQCDRQILLHRLLAGLLLLLALGTLIVALRARRDSERFPGDPII